MVQMFEVFAAQYVQQDGEESARLFSLSMPGSILMPMMVVLVISRQPRRSTSRK